MWKLNFNCPAIDLSSEMEAKATLESLILRYMAQKLEHSENEVCVSIKAFLDLCSRKN